MMRCLRDVNVDYTHVGWYQCSVMESYVNITTIDTQYSYQVEFGRRCICLVFDPLRTQRGKIALKAIRLSDKFMKLARELLTKKDSEAVSVQDTVITQELLSKMNITSEDMFEELPIKIHNLSLVESLLFDVEVCFCFKFIFLCQAKLTPLLLLYYYKKLYFKYLTGTMRFGSVTVWLFRPLHEPTLERVVEGMIECLDDLTSEYNKYQYYQRKMAQQKLAMQKKKDKTQEEEEIALKAMAQQQPNRLESLLIAHQVHNYCQQVNQFTGASLEKLYVAEFALKQQSK